MHATGAMKAMLDHFAYLWMPHRPAPELFAKRAVIITVIFIDTIPFADMVVKLIAPGDRGDFVKFCGNIRCVF